MAEEENQASKMIKYYRNSFAWFKGIKSLQNATSHERNAQGRYHPTGSMEGRSRGIVEGLHGYGGEDRYAAAGNDDTRRAIMTIIVNNFHR